MRGMVLEKTNKHRGMVGVRGWRAGNVHDRWYWNLFGSDFCVQSFTEKKHKIPSCGGETGCDEQTDWFDSSPEPCVQYPLSRSKFATGSSFFRSP